MVITLDMPFHISCNSPCHNTYKVMTPISKILCDVKQRGTEIKQVEVVEPKVYIAWFYPEFELSMMTCTIKMGYNGAHFYNGVIREYSCSSV